MAELRHSDLVDPFRDFPSLSRSRRTLAGFEPAGLESQELEPIQSVFESMARNGSTTQVVEQVRTIMDSYTDLESVRSEDRDETVAPNGKNPAQERRPALGRKRAKFSLKPVPSHSFPTVDLQSSIDHIEDPEEYFSVVEQREKADKELQKLRGETSADLLQHPTTTARKRRPGILGKRVCYKHQFSANDVSSEALVESQEELIDGRISSPLKALAYIELSNASHCKATKQPGTFQTNITNSKSQDTSGTGTEAEKDKRTDNVLEKLLSSFQDLDGDEGETLLRESLQMKSIDVGKICLPDLGAIRRIDRNLDNKRVTRGQVKGSEFSQTSPSRKKSPFAGIATLQRRASLISSRKNLYSVYPSDELHCGDSLDRGLNEVPPSPLLTESRDKRGLVVRNVFSPVTKSGAESSSVKKTHVPAAEADEIIIGEITIDKELPVKTPHSSDRDTEHCSNCIGVDKDIISSGPDGCLQEEGSSMELDPSISNRPDLDRASIDHARTEYLASELDGCLQEENNIILDHSVDDYPDVGVGGPNSDSIDHTRIEDLASAHHRSMGEKCSNYGTNADAPFGLDDTSHAEANTTIGDEAADVEAANDNSSPLKTTLAVDQDQDQGGLSTSHKRNDEGNKMASGASPNSGRKVKAVAHRQERKSSILKRQDRRERKSSILKRQSLADAGMLWKSGVRRSSRIRSRPLEYWRGERFLYGRIHDSLTTVIGVKCASPGNTQLKVKSFVPDKYKDLVAQAASH